MNFTVRDYLIINTVIAIFLIYYFLFWKRPRKESGFHSKQEQFKKQDKRTTKNSKEHPLHLKTPFSKNTDQKDEDIEIKSEPGSLNVIFMYNSHEWDAYEVLGLPAGSSMEKVKEHHRKALLKMNKKSRKFFDAAYKAIFIHRRQSSNQKN